MTELFGPAASEDGDDTDAETALEVADETATVASGEDGADDDAVVATDGETASSAPQA
jgi:hypothetical protein